MLRSSYKSLPEQLISATELLQTCSVAVSKSSGRLITYKSSVAVISLPEDL